MRSETTKRLCEVLHEIFFRVNQEHKIAQKRTQTKKKNINSWNSFFEF